MAAAALGRRSAVFLRRRDLLIRFLPYNQASHILTTRTLPDPTPAAAAAAVTPTRHPTHAAAAEEAFTPTPHPISATAAAAVTSTPHPISATAAVTSTPHPISATAAAAVTSTPHSTPAAAASVTPMPHPSATSPHGSPSASGLNELDSNPLGRNPFPSLGMRRFHGNYGIFSARDPKPSDTKNGIAAGQASSESQVNQSFNDRRIRSAGYNGMGQTEHTFPLNLEPKSFDLQTGNAGRNMSPPFDDSRARLPGGTPSLDTQAEPGHFGVFSKPQLERNKAQLDQFESSEQLHSKWQPSIDSKAGAPFGIFSSDQRADAKFPEQPQPQLPAEPQPVGQLMFDNQADIDKEIWEGSETFVGRNPLTFKPRSSRLNKAIKGPEQFVIHLSDPVGIDLTASILCLMLVNNNKGFCIKDSLTTDNLLVCPRLRKFRFKRLRYTKINPNSAKDRATAYQAGEKLLLRLLELSGVDKSEFKLLAADLKDLLSKLRSPPDERLIFYHAVLMFSEGKYAFYQKIFDLLLKEWKYCAGFEKKHLSSDFLCLIAYSTYDGTLPCLTEIIMEHPLFEYIHAQNNKGGQSMLMTMAMCLKSGDMDQFHSGAFLDGRKNCGPT
ncbi:unnamed protein product [Urochloa humidicola]